MEVVQGNSRDKKVVVAQEIAFAKVLAGNNKTLRDRAVKKLRKWLTIRGNGKWEFTEEEFIRIWTGLFYCMWMSDKFLVQEELAESISRLIHCFKKNCDSALLFIKCFNKRILMDWEGLDQYRINKFQMLSRRFLRQTFVYCKEKNWDESLVNKLTGIFYNVILQRDNSLGFVLHFISIYPQELTKVGGGKLDSQIVLKLIEPFIKLLARSKDLRIQKETEEFFIYLMNQTDAGIEFEERFNAWKEQGCPGEGPQCMMNVGNSSKDTDLEMGNNIWSEEEDEEDMAGENKLLDPRAGSVDVFLPQLTIDIDGLINLFKKHQNSKQSDAKGRKLLRSLTQKFHAVGKGRFPVKIKKNPALLEKVKNRQTEKIAKELLKFTHQLDEAPVATEEFRDMIKELEDEDENLSKESTGDEEVDRANDAIGFVQEDAIENGESNEEKQPLQLDIKKKKKNKNKKKRRKDKSLNDAVKTDIVKKQKTAVVHNNKSDQKKNSKQNFEKKIKKEKSNKAKLEGKSTKQILANMDVVVTPKKKKLMNGTESDVLGHCKKDILKVTPVHKAGIKRKILSNWQVQELDTNSPEYYKIETPKVITIQRKLQTTSFCKENEPDSTAVKKEDSEEKPTTETQKKFLPVFWEKAKVKANKQSGNKSKVCVNPFAKIQEESTTPNRRISFALERNMAQENEQYLKEVKNSPRVPFDGSKKPVQSALKCGLAPSPVNPFYHFKKIRLQSV